MNHAIVFVVCQNGLGHFKRVVGIAHALLELNAFLEIHFVCEVWQPTKLTGWDKLDSLKRQRHVHFHFGYMTSSFVWSKSETDFTQERLYGWVKGLQQLKPLREAALVVSDNLPGVLEIRPDALLAGSFLWLDVLSEAFPNHLTIAGFAMREKELLNQCKPPMFCVADLAMEQLWKWTTPIPLNWMCQFEKKKKPAGSKFNRIALLAGATDAANAEMCELTDLLLESTGLNLSLPARFIQKMNLENNPRVNRFGFEQDDFFRCDAVFCRPGAGTLTDCVAASTPMILFDEGDNLEMKSNGQKMQNKGVARYIGFPLNHDAVLESLSLLYGLDEPQLPQMIQRLNAIPTDGLTQAAAWLDNRINSISWN